MDMRAYFTKLMLVGLLLLCGNLASAQQQPTITNAASFETDQGGLTHRAAHSLLVLFASRLSSSNWIAGSLTSPLQEWPFETPDGVKLEYKSAGSPNDNYKPCEMVSVFTDQMNFYFPGDGGFTTFRLTRGRSVGGTTQVFNENIGNIAIGAFSANGTGQGPIVGQLFSPDGEYIRPTFTRSATTGELSNDPVPLTIAGKSPALSFFITGTGRPPRADGLPFRPSKVSKVTVGGVEQEILFNDTAGFRGQEQVNVLLNPRTPLGNNLPVFILGAGNHTTIAPTISIQAGVPSLRKMTASHKKKPRKTKKHKRNRP